MLRFYYYFYTFKIAEAKADFAYNPETNIFCGLASKSKW